MVTGFKYILGEVCETQNTPRGLNTCSAVQRDAVQKNLLFNEAVTLKEKISRESEDVAVRTKSLTDLVCCSSSSLLSARCFGKGAVLVDGVLRAC
ncbi:hypothetical protein CEXT_551571 [Caerostris extrusa]|uniref:Uncharacterized protein n=1 Tax=Caerostris extrusa TaxID=172846 RepID=A0AAV4SSS0_CAEEX|nr:hypothetical protein CEXT_551571 [Caerostris extrusa]